MNSNNVRYTHRSTAFPCLAACSAASLFMLGLSSASAAEPLKVCFLYSNPIGESGWTYQHELARKELVAALGAKISTKSLASVAFAPTPHPFSLINCRISGFFTTTKRVGSKPNELGDKRPVSKIKRKSSSLIFLLGSYSLQAWRKL
mgnify:CR=1 FL=1